MRFKKAYRKSWTLDVWFGRLDSAFLEFGLLDSGLLDTWTLYDWTLGLLTTGRLESWTLEACTLGIWTPGGLDSGRLETWTMDDWTLGLWTLVARKFFPYLVTSIYFLLLVNIEFVIFSNTLRLMYYGSVERAANDCYYSTLLQLILQFKFPSDRTTCP